MRATYGLRLRDALKLRGVSRKQLADHLGITVQAIGQVINGPTVALTAENHEKAAKLLRVDGYWLATGEGDLLSSSSDWPFQSIDRKKIQALDGGNLAIIETSVILYAERHGLDVSLSNSSMTAA